MQKLWQFACRTLLVCPIRTKVIARPAFFMSDSSSSSSPAGSPPDSPAAASPTSAEIVLNHLRRGRNVFLTGGAGVGKTYTTREVLQTLERDQVFGIKCAPTGVAALQVLNGRTIHSCFRIPIKPQTSYEEFGERVGRRTASKVREPWVQGIINAQYVLIDEISMCSAHLLELLDIECRIIRRSPEPMGGLTILAVGDFLQLPPVYNTKTTQRPHPRQKLYCFNSPVWKALSFEIITLTKVYRQGDADFSRTLNLIRHGRTLCIGDVDRLRSRCLSSGEKIDPKAVRIMIKRTTVMAINTEKLAQLGRKMPMVHYNFPIQRGGDPDIVRAMESDIRENIYMASDHHFQTYCTGARVMQIMNNSSKGYVNGDRGTIVGFAEVPKSLRVISADPPCASIPFDWKDRSLHDSIPDTGGFNWWVPIVLFDRTGREMAMMPYMWTRKYETRPSVGQNKDDYCAWVVAFALCLSWACTVHKVQGCTLSGKVHIDCNLMDWVPAGFYVALSRATGLENVTFSNFTGRFKCNLEAREFYGRGCRDSIEGVCLFEDNDDGLNDEMDEAVRRGMRGEHEPIGVGLGKALDEHGDKNVNANSTSDEPPAPNPPHSSVPTLEEFRQEWSSTVEPMLDRLSQKYGRLVAPNKRRPELYGFLDNWAKRARRDTK